MKGCHDCPVAGDIEAGVYANATWDQIPCSTCKVADQQGYAIEFDEGRQAVDVGKSEVCPPELNDRTLMPIAVMRDCVAGLLSLPPDLRDVVAWRFGGMSYQEIGDVQGVSMAAAEKRHRRAMQLWPGLEALFLEKKVKQKWRKKHATKKKQV